MLALRKSRVDSGLIASESLYNRYRATDTDTTKFGAQRNKHGKDDRFRFTVVLSLRDK